MRKVVIRLMGGLGNQLFQYAFGKQLAKKNHMELFVDTSSYLRKGSRTYDLKSYAINEHELNRIESLIYNFMYYANAKFGIASKYLVQEEKTFLYQNIEVRPNSYFDGYWQNEKYFENIRNELLQTFTLKEPYDYKVKKIVQEMHEKESVAVHVRRGDYLKKEYASIYVTQDMSYYQSAKKFLNSKRKNLKYYIFSDDIQWCRSNFDWNDCCFVDEQITEDAVVQFEMMRNCKHFIIANSTYSWWAAWLGTWADGLRIAPNRWYINETLNTDCKKALLSKYMVI